MLSCPRCNSSRKMSVIGARISVPPPVLIVRFEYRSPKGTVVDLTKNNGRAKSKVKKGERTPIDLTRAEDDENVMVDYSEVSGFRADLEVVLEGHTYKYVGSIMHYPGHFWATVSYSNQIWYYGIGAGLDVHLGEEEAGNPFVTRSELRGKPVSHFYTLKKDGCG